jgi:hypothetical protein
VACRDSVLAVFSSHYNCSISATYSNPCVTVPGRSRRRGQHQISIYHFQAERYFGSTQTGKFMCQKTADAEGDRPTRNNQ